MIHNERMVRAMRKAGLLSILVVVVLLAVAVIAEGQQPKKVPRIGYLSATSPSVNPTRIEGFRQGLRELGYVQGKNIVIEWRYAEGKPDRFPALAAELVHLKVDVIVTGGPTITPAVKEATLRFPLSWGMILILSARGSLPVLPDLAEISQG
jgi:putative ABC transport system substrate-binding protein